MTLDQITSEAMGWVNGLAQHHLPHLRPLNTNEAVEMAKFFGKEVCATVRIASVYEIPNPPFRDTLISQGLSVLDFRSLSGLTLGSCILVSESRPHPNSLALLFHECVHVVQYALLGLDEFIKSYINGWVANEFDYYRIPHEVMAYGLETRYAQNPYQAFDVRRYIETNINSLLLREARKDEERRR